ncbi:MAG: aspartate/glutamate racemase family protein [Alphaproteobacteria bacterium]|nr:aspartate/glutamate racemase family protein [Alphaproteobacteria bacterium]
MKVIGILGGMSIESTIDYIKLLSKHINDKLGGQHSPKIAMKTVDFDEIEHLQHQAAWDKLGKIMAEEAKSIQNAGADFLVIATNTMHKLVPEVEQAINIPLLHIAKPTIDKIKEDGIKDIALLGTKFTMEQDFYKGRLLEANLNVIIPDETDRNEIHRIIYEELCHGKICPVSIKVFQDIIQRLADKGAKGVILGCTEIGMLVKTAPIKIYDTTAIHMEAAANLAIS